MTRVLVSDVVGIERQTRLHTQRDPSAGWVTKAMSKYDVAYSVVFPPLAAFTLIAVLAGIGAQVRRTDATPEFREIQRQRGHHVDLLNVVSDDLGGRTVVRWRWRSSTSPPEHPPRTRGKALTYMHARSPLG